MKFAERLTKVMNELGISQARLSELTGIGKSSISQYLSGKNEPSRARKREMAVSLGVQEDYFDTPFQSNASISKNSAINLPVETAAKLMGKSNDWIRQGLRDGVLPFGWAVKLSRWSYFISSVKFTEFTGIKVPCTVGTEQ